MFSVKIVFLSIKSIFTQCIDLSIFEYLNWQHVGLCNFFSNLFKVCLVRIILFILNVSIWLSSIYLFINLKTVYCFIKTL